MLNGWGERDRVRTFCSSFYTNLFLGKVLCSKLMTVEYRHCQKQDGDINISTFGKCSPGCNYQRCLKGLLTSQTPHTNQKGPHFSDYHCMLLSVCANCQKGIVINNKAQPPDVFNQSHRWHSWQLTFSSDAWSPNRTTETGPKPRQKLGQPCWHAEIHAKPQEVDTEMLLIFKA